MEHTVYDAPGRCIFCLCPYDAADFTDEHVIPFALSGGQEIYIQNGSCKRCNARANERYEALALAHDFKSARLLLQLKRRRRGKKKTPLLPPLVARGDTAQDLSERPYNVQLSSEEYPNLLGFVVFPAAGRLCGIDRKVINTVRMSVANIGDKPTQAKDVTMREVRKPGPFALTIAKIGYASAVAELGLDGFDGEDIRELLRCERADMFNFVGCDADNLAEPTTALHRIELGWFQDWLVARVQLFARYGMHPYHVAVGRRATL